MDAKDRIEAHRNSLTSAERRAAEAMLEDPQAVAFCTVAEFARRAHVGAATVVRLASKLGFDGYAELQQSIQQDLSHQLRPAVERIREPTPGDLRATHATHELGNVERTLDAVDPVTLRDTTKKLCDPKRGVAVISGDATRGIAMQFVTDLESLRDDVHLVDGNEVAVRRHLALLAPSELVISIDVRRYERWLLATLDALPSRVWKVAITDSVLSPVAQKSDRTFVVSADAVGPFDSHVGTLALTNLLVASVSERLRTVATSRLDRIERVWNQTESLVDR